ncbi:MAG TPA: peptide ABC transporter permease, partial [Gammaproteobacteria bacterium]|nr:peptide ABC transporter permease [Gammaproteobacteria bacterium]MCH79071.1 peptide ABC transporter permease [Gammaproteobacteria bacterium]
LVRRPAAVAALVILLPYIGVALLDSLHFRAVNPADGASAGVQSVLDRLLTPLRTRTETTYSAPLALHSYSKETRPGADGR